MAQSVIANLPTLSTSTKVKIWCLQFIVVLVLLLFSQVESNNFLGKPLKLNADLTSLFDSEVNSEIDSDKQAIAQIADKISQAASRQNIILVGATSLELAVGEADAFARKLSQISSVSSVQTNFSKMAQLSDISKQYLPFKQQLLSQAMTTLLSEGSSEDIFAYQFSLLNQVANQAVSLTIEQAPQLALADFLSRPLSGSSALTLKNEHLVSKYQNKYYVLVSFSTDSDGINIDSAQQFVAEFSKLVNSQEPMSPQSAAQTVYEYIYTGAIFYTSKASSTGQGEMMLYGGISLLATLLLIAFVYRNVTAMVATFTLIAISFIYGYLALSLFYSEISIIALIFSVTLIGIAADYSFHALTQLKFTAFTSSEREQPLANIRASLLMSYLTTGAGYALLLLAPFSLFKHIAVFTLFGLLGALVTVLLLYPVLLPLLTLNEGKGKAKDKSKDKSNNQSATMPSFAGYLNQLQQRFVGVVAKYKLLTLTTFVAAILSMGLVQFDNDIRGYYAPDAQLQANENKVKAILRQKWDLQYFLVQANSAQALLELEEQLVAQLALQVSAAQLSGFSAISQWLPSISKQKANKQLLSGAVQQGKMAKLQNMLSQGDWQVEQTFKPLLPEQWFNSSLGKMYQSQWLPHENKFYSVVRLSGVQSTAILTEISRQLTISASASGQVNLIDKAGSISAQLAQFSRHLTWVILAAVVAALLVFISRYGLQVALLAVATPLFSLMLALLASFYLQTYLTIFNLVAGILILALGLDYSVFYAEHGLHKKVTLTTVMSALSSVFVFAILVLSSMSAISSFGLTVFIGVLITFILAPIVTLANGRSKIAKEDAY